MVSKLHILAAFEAFIPRERDRWMFENESVKARIRHQIRHFPAIVLPSPDNPVVIAGVIHHAGVGEVWMMASDDLPRFKRLILRQLRILVPSLPHMFQLRRMHALIDSRDRAAKRWAEKVGFRFEVGPLKGLGSDGGDRDFYVLTQGE